jgi:Trk K+ transport system NAD-binding subunit
VRTLIVGVGQLGRVLAAELEHAGHDVRVLDPERDSPLDRAVLAEASRGCDAVACVADDDNLNAVVALAARRRLHVPLALAVVANPARAEALTGLGAHVVCPTARTAHHLVAALVRSGVETELTFGGAVALFRAEVPARLGGRRLDELGDGEIVAVAIERGLHVVLAAPDLVLEEGDVLHVAASDRDVVRELVRP